MNQLTLDFIKYSRTVILFCLITSISHLSLADSEIKSIEKQRLNLSNNGDMEVVMSELSLPPGASIPLHTHHGDELVYILQGGTAQKPNGELIEYAAGTTVAFPRDLIHGGFVVIGELTLKAITIHIVDKGKELMVPVEQ